jgi:hypothetical protein
MGTREGYREVGYTFPLPPLLAAAGVRPGWTVNETVEYLESLVLGPNLLAEHGYGEVEYS